MAGNKITYECPSCLQPTNDLVQHMNTCPDYIRHNIPKKDETINFEPYTSLQGLVRGATFMPIKTNKNF